MTSTGLLISSYTNVIQSVFSIDQLYKEVFQLINDNNNYLNLHNVTNLGLYNKLILVTQKQVLELYITTIECKTLYSFCIPHTVFPDATKATTNPTTNEVHLINDRGIRTSHVTLLKYAIRLNIDISMFPTVWAVLSIFLDTQDDHLEYVKLLHEEYNKYYESRS